MKNGMQILTETGILDRLSIDDSEVLAKAIDANSVSIVDEYNVKLDEAEKSGKTEFFSIKDKLPKLDPKNTVWEVSDLVLLKGVAMKNTLGYIRRALQDWPIHDVKTGDVQCYSMHNEALPKANKYAMVN